MDRNQGQRPGTARESTSEFVGPYCVRGELAQGQLTTLSLAQRKSPMGVMRSYAVKRLRAPHANQPEYTELLLDEARLSAGLLHLNVVGICDAGSEREPYVVMDYVEGENLQNILTRAGECHPRFLVPVLVDVLNGLYALHTAVNEVGTALRLVHQAPTAHHVLVGSDGMARLCDFGQARAVSSPLSRQRSDKLQVASMAPEQALDPARVDSRTDLFVVGLVLWEALTGERLFGAESEAAAFHNLLHRKIPRPSEVGHRPPRCFDSIAMRALEREPAKRYASALEMARDLRDVGMNEGYYATTSDLGQWVRELYGRELEARRFLLEGRDEEREGAGTSGLFSAPRMGENPYGSGRIYGGSHAQVDVGYELDRTPAFGVRTGSMESLRDPAQPMRVREVDARRTPDERSLTPSGARISQRPPALAREAETRPLPVAPSTGVSARPGAYGAGSSAPRGAPRSDVLDQRKASATEPYGSPASEPIRSTKDESENTNPVGFVPARPGARRSAGQQSPGAYSEVKTRRRGSSPDPFEEEVDTSRIEAIRHSQSPQPAEGRPRNARAVEPPRSKAIHEEKGSIGGRRDSAPARLPLPAEPVGSPIHVPDPGPATPFELPPPVTLDELALRRTLSDAIRMPDSLSPPDGAARTHGPPAASSSARGRGLGFWLSAGLLMGVIAVAAVVGVRDLTEQLAGAPAPVQHAAGATGIHEKSVAERPVAVTRVPAVVLAPGPSLDAERPAMPAAEVLAEPVPSGVEPETAQRANAPSPLATPAVGPAGRPATTSIGPARLAVRPGVVPPRPGPKAALKKPAVRAKLGPASGGTAAPAARTVGPDMAERKPPARPVQLPDNPY